MRWAQQRRLLSHRYMLRSKQLLKSPPGCTTCSGRCGDNHIRMLGCSCDAKCMLFNQCCPDFKKECPSEYNKSQIIYLSKDTPKLSCMYNIWCRCGLSYISSCPHNEKACSRNGSHVNKYLPVSDNRTGLHYSNILCAMCNGVEEIIPWSIKIRSTSHTRENIFKDSVKLGEISKYFVQPNGISSTYCTNALSKCTANWTRDKDIKSCEQGPENYVHNENFTFRNLFCAVCNDFKVHTLKCGLRQFGIVNDPTIFPPGPSPSYFSAEYLFDIHEHRGLTLQNQCHPNEEYLKKEGKCRQTYRSTSYLQDGRKYIFVYATFSSASCSVLLPYENAQRIARFIEKLMNLSVNCDVHSATRDWSSASDRIRMLCSTNQTSSSRHVVFGFRMALSRANVNVSKLAALLPGSVTCQMYSMYSPWELDVYSDGTMMLPHGDMVDIGNYRMINNSVVVCSATRNKEVWIYSRVLGWITIVAMSVSIISLIVHLFLQYCSGNKDTKSDGLVYSILLSHSLFLISPWFLNVASICYALGVLLHASFLWGFTWLTVIAADILWLIVKTSKFQHTKTNRNIRRWLLSFVPPFFLVFLAVALDLSPSVSDAWRPLYGYSMCWMNNRRAILLFFVLPLAICVVFSLILTIISAYKLNDLTDTQAASHRNKYGIFIKMFIITGALWTSGFVAVPTKNEIVFGIFIALNGFQGLWILVINWCPTAIRNYKEYRRYSLRSNSTATSRLLWRPRKF